MSAAIQGALDLIGITLLPDPEQSQKPPLKFYALLVRILRWWSMTGIPYHVQPHDSSGKIKPADCWL